MRAGVLGGAHGRAGAAAVGAVGAPRSGSMGWQPTTAGIAGGHAFLLSADIHVSLCARVGFPLRGHCLQGV